MAGVFLIEIHQIAIPVHVLAIAVVVECVEHLRRELEVLSLVCHGFSAVLHMGPRRADNINVSLWGCVCNP